MDGSTTYDNFQTLQNLQPLASVLPDRFYFALHRNLDRVYGDCRPRLGMELVPVMEEWRPVPHVPLLEVSNLGRVRSRPYELTLPSGGVCVRQMKPTKGHITNPSGNYPRYQVNFRRKSYMVSRLVCIAFHGEPPFKKAEAMHRNENSLDNQPDNLEWGTRQENANAPQYLRYCRETGVQNLRGAPCGM